MGFDLFGINQKSKVGKCFRSNAWWWYPLWDCLCSTCADILSEEQMNGGYFNDGMSIEAWQAQLIAERLYGLLESGKPREVETMLRSEFDSLPLVECNICDGTGRMEEGKHKGEACLLCGGESKARFSPYPVYKFTEDNMKDFALLCSQSGGFSVC